MKTTPARFLLTLGLLAASALPVAAEEANADQLLRQMSAKLASAQSFNFRATREIDPALLPGRTVPEKAQLAVTVQRPNKIAAESISKDGVRRFYANGQDLTLVDATKNLYATVPMKTSIDGLVEEVDLKYGFTPPLAELALSDDYQDIRRKAQSISYLGQGDYTDGTVCHRLALSGRLVDAELWLGVGDQLPRRLIVTVKNRPGKPHLKVEFSNWNLTAKADQGFVFVPAKGALKVPMIPITKTTASQESLPGSFGKESPVLLATPLQADHDGVAFGWVAARGGFVAAGRGYGYGYGGVRYGAVGYRGLPAGYYGAIPGAYRSVYYGGYNCYYAGGAYYRPAFYQGNTVYIVVR